MGKQIKIQIQNNQIQQNEQTIHPEQKKKKRKILVAIIGAVAILLAPIVGWVAYDCIVNKNSSGNEQLLILASLKTWGDIIATPQKNAVTIKGKINQAGCYVKLPDQNLKNKTVMLKIENVNASEFTDDAMIKITMNENDTLIHPVNISFLVYGEYVHSNYDKIEFALPSNFDGKLGFVFYQANLNNLRITAYYKE